MENVTVMVLNASSEPMHLVRLGRAMALVFGEKADIVTSVGYVRTGRHSFPLPSVIRLRRYVHIPWRNAVLTLRNLNIRDGGLCQWCRNNRGETVDHVVPKSRGGAHRWENVVLACRACNGKKGNKLPEELGWKLHFTPATPTKGELAKLDPRHLEKLLLVS